MIPVDALLMSAGWTPSVHMFSQSRGKVAWDEASRRFLPGAYAQDCVSVGACNGTDGLQATIDEALAAGEARREGRTRDERRLGGHADQGRDDRLVGRRHGRQRRGRRDPTTSSRPSSTSRTT